MKPNSKPIVSVIIPVYNAEKFLGECLDSVLSQTRRDIEVLCIDDGSIDGSKDILECYANKDSRVTVVLQANSGPAAARNKGLELAQGKYVLFVDSDDVIDPALCEKTVETAEKNQSDMVFYYFKRVSVSHNIDGVLDRMIRENGHFVLPEQDFATSAVFMEYYSGPWAKLWRKSFLETNGLSFPSLHYGEDFALHWIALMDAPRIALCREPLYFYRDNPGSLMNDPGHGYGKDVVALFDFIKRNLLDRDLYRLTWKQLFLFMKLRTIYTRYIFLEKRHGKEMLPQIRKTLGHEEHEFMKSANDLPLRIKLFYRAVNDGRFINVLVLFFNILKTLKKNVVIPASKFTDKNGNRGITETVEGIR